MMQRTGKPKYDLNKVKVLVGSNRFRITGTLRRQLENHGFDAHELIVDVFESMEESGFQKQLKLDKFDGEIADVYKVFCYDEEWYVKFFMQEDGTMVLILSCKFFGSPY